MKYMGSKARLTKEIVPIIENYLEDREYVEPFVGGANVIDKISAYKRTGYDKNKYLIGLLRHVSSGGLLPETISEEIYYKVRDNKDRYIDWKVGLVGFCASYGGRFFEGYPRGKNKDGTPRDYTNEAIRNIEKQRSGILDVNFMCKDFNDVDYSESHALIYCDPPYKGSKPYKVSLLGKFDHDKFWRWASHQSKFNPVIVSEYEAPKGWVCIWSKGGIKSNLKSKGSKESVEKMFIAEKWVNPCK